MMENSEILLKASHSTEKRSLEERSHFYVLSSKDRFGEFIWQTIKRDRPPESPILILLRKKREISVGNELFCSMLQEIERLTACAWHWLWFFCNRIACIIKSHLDLLQRKLTWIKAHMNTFRWDIRRDRLDTRQL